MNDSDALMRRFEANRTHLRAVAYQLLGSLSEADDAVQEAWLRFNGADVGDVANLRGWLTTVVARISLNMLRSRKARREEPLDSHVPDPIVSPVAGLDPEHEALLADSVGLALLVVLTTLTPTERLAFVLHDVFDVPFDEIGQVVERSPTAARQLASRARRRIRGSAIIPDTDVVRQREVVDAFLAAARDGDFDALLEVLDPDVVLRADYGATPAGASAVVRGARKVAEGARAFSSRVRYAKPVLVNATAGIVVSGHGRLMVVMGFTVRHGRIVEIDILADPERLRRLDLPILETG